MKRRVVITGIGVISPNGIGKENFWNALKKGKSGIRKITSFDTTDLPVKIAGEVIDFKPEDYIADKKKIRRMARFSQFAVACAKMAIEDSNLNLKKIETEKMLVCLGVSTSAMDLIESQHKKFLIKGYKGITPFGIFAATPNMACQEILNELSLEIPLTTIASGCAAGLDAIGTGYKEIQNGNYEVVIGGGIDASITSLIIGGLCSSNIMSKRNQEPEKASRPFDKFRDGGILSEGGAILILENLTHAIKRNAKIYGEIIGYGKWGEREITNPGQGFEYAMKLCLKDAFLKPESIDYISAHGPSDPLLDYFETLAIKKVFGEYSYKIPISSIKSMIGNPFSSGGVLQLISGIMALTQKILPPTINYEYPDPLCDLDYVPNKPRICDVKYCLVNSHGFGGSNSSLIIKKYEDK
ncbi:MAG: beta-ketoacyl-[acyl-carrier-protein] synthase family protein [Candidatus Omnitrophica bacterium]|nr:beta-ketoacyl-[acyl-carrier-protein] synthase family protein [Candidatus Omnitrophota bacterium]